MMGLHDHLTRSPFGIQRDGNRTGNAFVDMNLIRPQPRQPSLQTCLKFLALSVTAGSCTEPQSGADYFQRSVAGCLGESAPVFPEQILKDKAGKTPMASQVCAEMIGHHDLCRSTTPPAYSSSS
jgi:hypothetical protein